MTFPIVAGSDVRVRGLKGTHFYPRVYDSPQAPSFSVCGPRPSAAPGLGGLPLGLGPGPALERTLSGVGLLRPDARGAESAAGSRGARAAAAGVRRRGSASWHRPFRARTGGAAGAGPGCRRRSAGGLRGRPWRWAAGALPRRCCAGPGVVAPLPAGRPRGSPDQICPFSVYTGWGEGSLGRPCFYTQLSCDTTEVGGIVAAPPWRRGRSLGLGTRRRTVPPADPLGLELPGGKDPSSCRCFPCLHFPGVSVCPHLPRRPLLFPLTTEKSVVAFAMMAILGCFSKIIRKPFNSFVCDTAVVLSSMLVS